MEIGGAGLTPEAGDAYQRTATVTGAASLTLRYDWINTVMDTDGSDNILVRYSSDGATWTTIRTINGDANATYVDVIPWTPANTTAYIRFEAEDPIEAGEQGAFDNISLEMNGSDDVIIECMPDGTTWTTAHARKRRGYRHLHRHHPLDPIQQHRFRALPRRGRSRDRRTGPHRHRAAHRHHRRRGTVRPTARHRGRYLRHEWSLHGKHGTLNWLTNWSENGTDDASTTHRRHRIINNHIEMGGAGLVVEANDELRRSVTVARRHQYRVAVHLGSTTSMPMTTL